MAADWAGPAKYIGEDGRKAAKKPLLKKRRDVKTKNKERDIKVKKRRYRMKYSRM